jgi:hypothetical protein
MPTVYTYASGRSERHEGGTNYTGWRNECGTTTSCCSLLPRVRFLSLGFQRGWNFIRETYWFSSYVPSPSPSILMDC